MSKLNVLKSQLRDLLSNSPLSTCLPSYPWEGAGEWEEVVRVISDVVNNNTSVINDEDQLLEWFEKFQFTRQTKLYTK